jgi:tRNA A-37 threonylcarbamoyl transferase component Bud32
MTSRSAGGSSHEIHLSFYCDILKSVSGIMAKQYGMKKISIRSINVGISRLSNPVKITGLNKRGKKISYFGKIMGNSDILTDRSIQLLKNVYLQIHDQEPLFGIFETTEDMVREQYENLQAIHRIGIPTARPHGYYWLKGPSWLLVTEFLDAKPISVFRQIEPNNISTVFGYINRMHSKRIFHGDLKPDNIMVGDKIYILDIGHLRKDVSAKLKQAYDLACLLCCFLEFCPIEEILKVARKYYTRQALEAAADYIELVQMRPDIHFSDETKKKLLHSLQP